MGIEYRPFMKKYNDVMEISMEMQEDTVRKLKVGQVNEQKCASFESHIISPCLPCWSLILGHTRHTA